MARQLLFVRHARIAPRYAGRYVGRTDVPLEPHGLKQAEQLVALLRSRKPERCYCSPLVRARQTADVICDSIGLPVEVDEDLREIDFGRWEGRTFEEIAALDSAAVGRWAALSDDFAFPGGESVGGFFTRVGRAADRLAADPTRVALVVTHGGVIRGSLCHFLGLPPRHYLLFDVRHATCTTIDLMEGRGVLTGLNEQCGSERV
jgi:alpha-ribazole phosphatase